MKNSKGRGRPKTRKVFSDRTIVCPKCIKSKFQYAGKTKKGTQRYLCECGKNFSDSSNYAKSDHQ